MGGIENKNIDKIKIELKNTESNIENLENKLAKYYTTPESHSIKSGENLDSIAKKFNTTTEFLLKLNPQIKDKNNIFIGQKVHLPNSIDVNSIKYKELLYCSELLEILKEEKEKKKMLKGYIINRTKEKIENELKDIPGYIFNDFNKDQKDVEEIITIWNSDRGKVFKKYEAPINNYRSHPAFRDEIPLKTVLLLLIREGSWGDPYRECGVKGMSSFGLGQLTEDTWDFICKYLQYNKQYNYKNNISIDRSKKYDPDTQIKAMLLYLDYCAREHNCNYQEAIVYYHMGPGAKTVSDKNIQEYFQKNTPIKNLILEAGISKADVTAKIYMKYAAKYYSTL